MKRIFSFIFIVLWICTPALAQQKVNSFSELEWLEGKWERLQTRPGQTAFEIWEKTDAGLKGKGVTLQGSDTVFVEKLTILKKENDLYYVADVNPNVEPVYFRITEMGADGFVCENPEHDFPKKIEYRREEGSQLRAVISGNGNEIPFLFKKQQP